MYLYKQLNSATWEIETAIYEIIRGRYYAGYAAGECRSNIVRCH